MLLSGTTTPAAVRPARRRVAASLAVAVCALTVGTLPASAATSSTSQYQVTIVTPRQSPLVNVPFAITGSVTPAAAGATVQLQRLVSGTYSTVATATLDSSSAYAFSQVFSAEGGYTFRVLKPSGHGLLQGVSPAARVFVTGDTLLVGRIMQSGNGLISASGSYRLTMQPTGDLTISLTSTGRVIWSIGSAGNPGAWAELQHDGDLVVYSASGAVLKDTGSGGNPSGTYSMTIQEDSNLVIFRHDGTSLWTSNTKNSALDPNESLLAGQFLRSPGLRYQLSMQSDGNLVLYDTKTGLPIWASNTAVVGSKVVMGTDGNLVVFGPTGKSLWSTDTSGHAGAAAVLQDDGNFVVYQGSVAIWASKGIGGVLGDDYPAYLRNATQDSIIDPWRFYNRECVSFVAWRLNNTNHVAFSNYMDGGHFGNANTWDDNARALGYVVNNVPARGAVAQSDTQGSTGHVAWVAAVGNGTVTVEEYNYVDPGEYDVRTVPTSTYVYIHIQDL